MQQHPFLTSSLFRLRSGGSNRCIGPNVDVIALVSTLIGPPGIIGCGALGGYFVNRIQGRILPLIISPISIFRSRSMAMFLLLPGSPLLNFQQAYHQPLYASEPSTLVTYHQSPIIKIENRRSPSNGLISLSQTVTNPFSRSSRS